VEITKVQGRLKRKYRALHPLNQENNLSIQHCSIIL